MQGFCRSPYDPDTMVVKRLIALEGDWVTLPDHIDVKKIPQVQTWGTSVGGANYSNGTLISYRQPDICFWLP